MARTLAYTLTYISLIDTRYVAIKKGFLFIHSYINIFRLIMIMGLKGGSKEKKKKTRKKHPKNISFQMKEQIPRRFYERPR